MKRSISVVLLFVLLFNLAGYNLLFWALKYQAKQELIEHIDTNSYAADNTLTIKVPISIPYQNDWTSYERVDGEFEHKGEFYKLVKQKLASDTLYIVCIKDHKQKRLNSALTDFTKLVHDLPGTSHTLKLLGSFQKEYQLNTTIELFNKELGWLRNVNFSTVAFPLLCKQTEIVSPPPKSHS